MKKNAQTHALLLALVGGYVLYIAYHLFENLQAGAGDMPLPAAITAIALFGLGGIAVLLYALHIYRQSREDDQRHDDDQTMK